jgi:hypothetical protein
MPIVHEMRAKSLVGFLLVVTLVVGFFVWAKPRLDKESHGKIKGGPQVVVVNMPSVGG